MKQFSDPIEMHDYCVSQKRAGKSVGVVPTMGALHEGHLSLVRQAAQECDVVIATIFVNPTQFAPSEDLDKYPRTLEKDCELLAQVGAEAVFVPTNDTMYPDDFSTFVDPPKVAKRLEGEHRPTHFRGVATIVLKLFNIILANRAYFGQKDFQQTRVIKQMVKDLNVHIDIRVCSIVRDEDGLALSSRNVYLTEEGRQRALSLSRSLVAAKKAIEDGEREVARIVLDIREAINASNPDSIDYVRIVSANDLVDVDLIRGEVAILVAAFFDKTRLIDNIVVQVNE